MPGIKKLYVRFAVLLSVLVGGFAFFSVPLSVLADVSQPDSSTADTTASGQAAQWGIDIGTGYSGTITGFQFYASSVSNPANNPLLHVEQYSDAGYTTNIGECIYYPDTSASSPGYMTAVYSSSSGLGCTVSSSSYVELIMNLSNFPGFGQTFVAGGTLSLPTGWSYDANTGVPTHSILAVPAFILSGVSNGSTPPGPDTSHTQFYSFTPALGTTTPVATSTSFAFEATGYITSGDYQSGSTQVLMSYGVQPGSGNPAAQFYQDYGQVSIPVSSAGAFDATTTQSVVTPGTYPVTWILQNCQMSVFGFCIFYRSLVQYTGTVIVASTTQQQYDLVTSYAQVSGTATLLANNGSASTTVINGTTATSTIFASGFNLVSVVTNKFPFNWVVEYANVLSNLGSSPGQLGSSTVNTSGVITYTGVPSVTMDFSGLKELQKIPTTTAQTLTVTLFSAATLNQVAEIPGIQTMRLFISWFLWIELMLYAWRAASTQIFENPTPSSS